MIERSKYRAAFWAATVILLIGIMIAWFTLPVKDWVQAFDDWILAQGPWGVVLFGLVYVLVVIVLAPAEVMSIAAGFIFGAWGLALVVVCATIGASLAFLIARYFLRERVQALARRRPLFAAVDKAVESEGWKIVILLRLNPLVPFGLQNYAFGATNIGFWPYAIATFFGIMPGAGLYVYLGSLGRAAAGTGGIPKLVILAAGLVATAVLFFVVGRKAKARLQDIGVAD